METNRLRLVADHPVELGTLRKDAESSDRMAGIRPAEGMWDFLASPEISPEWPAKLETAERADSWICGFAVIHVQDQVAN